MRVAFDISGLKGNITGVGVYTTQLIQALSKTGEVDCAGTFKISRYKHHKDIATKVAIPILAPYIPFIYSILPHHFDVFHGTDFWIPPEGNFRKIVTVHDLAIYHPGLYSEERRKYSIPIFEKMLAKGKPDKVIVVSDFIKNEFLQRFPAFEGRVHTIYHGSEHMSQANDYPPLFDFPYIAYIGTVEARKNVLQLFSAFDMASDANPDLRLVMAGGTGGYQGEEIMHTIRTHPKADKVIYLGYIDHYTSKRMLRNAAMLVYPSLYEGFGFPILEGMTMGVPVITSNFGAMKEIASDAALTVNTMDAEAMATAILDLWQQENLRKEYINKGHIHVRTFSWAKCAQETMHHYKSLVE